MVKIDFAEVLKAGKSVICQGGGSWDTKARRDIDHPQLELTGVSGVRWLVDGSTILQGWPLVRFVRFSPLAAAKSATTFQGLDDPAEVELFSR